MQASDLARLPQPAADHVIAYGDAPQQVAELRLPKGPGPHPVVIVIHGGCWQTPWAMDHVRSLAAALTAEGFATWSLEYRRLGDPGGGWPGTLAGRGTRRGPAEAGSRRAPARPLRVVALGHSAGGQLALWLGARGRLPKDSSLWTADPLPLRGIVSLAGVTDLRAAAAANVCGDAVPRLLGGAPGPSEDRLRQASPIELLPLGVPQRLVCGALDRLVPNDLSRRHEAAARERRRRGQPRAGRGRGPLRARRPAQRRVAGGAARGARARGPGSPALPRSCARLAAAPRVPLRPGAGRGPRRANPGAARGAREPRHGAGRAPQPRARAAGARSGIESRVGAGRAPGPRDAAGQRTARRAGPRGDGTGRLRPGSAAGRPRRRAGTRRPDPRDPAEEVRSSGPSSSKEAPRSRSGGSSSASRPGSSGSTASQAALDPARELAGSLQSQVQALKVRAGLAGVLQQLLLEGDQQVTPGMLVARVTGLSAVVAVSADQAQCVQLGQRATVDTHRGPVGAHVARIDHLQDGGVRLELALEAALPEGARLDLTEACTVELSDDGR